MRLVPSRVNRWVLGRLPPDVANALLVLRAEIRTSRAHRAAVRRLAWSDPPSGGWRLNLGCGWKPKEGWLNIDLGRAADIRLDLRRPLPFADGTATCVYAEHFFEHLAYPGDAQRLLDECFRVLAPGGTISLVVPDTEAALRAYVHGDEEFFRQMQHRQPRSCCTPLDQVNFHFRQGGEHKWVWDVDSLRLVLEHAGFVGVRHRDFDSDLDSESRREGSLAVEATKPEAHMHVLRAPGRRRGRELTRHETPAAQRIGST